MKRLWVILFVIPLFAQENPCDDKEYIRLRGDGGHDLTLLDDVEFDYYIKFHKACRKAKEDLKKRDAVRLILEREENKSEPKPKTREQIIEENRKIAKQNLEDIESRKKKESLSSCLSIAALVALIGSAAYVASELDWGESSSAYEYVDYHWDQFYNENWVLIWRCRTDGGPNSGQFAVNSKCAGKPMIDTRWPAKSAIIK